MRLAVLLVLAPLVLAPLVLPAQESQPAPQPPMLIHKVAPEYTEEARQAKVEGVVVVAAVIGTDGKVHDAHVIRSLGHGLDEKALDCVAEWRFRPATDRAGTPVERQATMEIQFRLPK